MTDMVGVGRLVIIEYIFGLEIEMFERLKSS